jgi:hypothetical protein
MPPDCGHSAGSGYSALKVQSLRRFRPSINNTANGLIGFSRRSQRCRADHGLTGTRRASDTETASRHLPHGSGDVGLHEAAGPVHEVQEGLVLHPRGHRAAAEARGRAAVGVDRRSAAKGVTDPAPGDLRGRRWPWGLAVRPLAPVRSTERPTGEVIPATRRECADGHPADNAHRPRAHSPEEELEHLVLSDGMRFALASAS